ncbi:hypothetical protein PG984_012258 [Apiospora sp. TS-2023a]
MPMFKYSPLPATGYIRLVTILPGSDRLIRCKLEQHPVRSLPQFDALSYTWNIDPRDRIIFSEQLQDQRAIIVNDSHFNPQGNLYVALEALRHDGQSIPIWIDAICIDQYNDVEKGHQVNFMSRIYSSAQTVHAWLGPLGNDLLLSFKSIQAWQSSDVGHATYLERVLERSAVVPFFIRLENIRGCLSGEDSLDVVGHDTYYTQKENVIFNIDSEREEMFQGGHEKRTDLFFRALKRFGLAQSTDLRDRVYALLSLYIDTTDPFTLQADYTITCKQLFFAVLGFYRIKSECDCAELGGHLLKVLELDVGDMTSFILGTQPIIDEIYQITNHTTTNRQLISQFLKDFQEAAEYTKTTVDWTSNRDQYPERLCPCFLAACRPDKLGPQLCISDRLYHITDRWDQLEDTKGTMALIMRPSIIGPVVSGIAMTKEYKQSKYTNLGVSMACVEWSKRPSVQYCDMEGEVVWEHVPEVILANTFSAKLCRQSRFLEALRTHGNELSSLPEAIARRVVAENDQSGNTFLRLASGSVTWYARRSAICKSFISDIDELELELELMCAILESGRTPILGRTYPSDNPRSTCFSLVSCQRLLMEYGLRLVEHNFPPVLST